MRTSTHCLEVGALLKRFATGVVLVVAAAILSLGKPAIAAEDALAQRWAGVVEVPQGKLEFTVELTRASANGAAAGTIDIPMQGARGLPLSDVVVDGKTIRFSISQSSADFEFTVGEDPNRAQGTLKQNGMTIPASMRRLAVGEAVPAPAELNRPQTPKPPFPYETIQVQIKNQADGVKLAGTMALPPGAGPHPVVIFVSGSGPQDRDETIVGHKPFAVIADHLARQGVASLRCDDRGVSDSTGALADSSTEQLMGDVRAMIAFLAARSEIDPKRIGLIGHSDGASVVAGVAAENDDVSFLVLLAPPGMRGDELLRVQLEAILRASGVSRASIDAQLAVQNRLLEMLIAGAGPDKMRPVVVELVELQSGPTSPQSKPRIDAAVAAQITMLSSTWFRSFVAHDPQESLRKVRCPVLAVIGDLDLQVPPEQNLPPIRDALRQAENKRVTIRRLESLNHLLQRAKTGLPDEYQKIEQTIDPKALEGICDWISRNLRGRGT